MSVVPKPPVPRGRSVIRKPVKAADERLGLAPVIRMGLRYVFPDHWSFMLGEIALYAFIVLVATGIFLTFFYVPSDQTVTYAGSYFPLQGREMGAEYASVVRIVFDIPAGNFVRQMHHWAANIFIAAIVLHLLRIVYTGAFRKPRELNYWIGVTMLTLAIFEGFAGYSLVDDLLSGMGLVIAYGVALGIPFVGGALSVLVWGGEYPGSETFWPRLEIVHVLLIPLALLALISIHLAQIMRQHHTQFPGPKRTEAQVYGSPMWPAYALRSMGLFFAVIGVLALLGGLVQINPIWEWGPYEPFISTNGAQPDWYLGWLIGALRMMPPFEPHIGGYTLVGNPFWGGALFPLIVFAFLYLLPWLDRRFWGDRRRHHLLDRPRDNATRTAVISAMLAWVFTVFAAGSMDRFFLRSDISYEAQVWAMRSLNLVLPVLVFFVVRRLCRQLKARESHPLREWTGRVVRRAPTGGFETVLVDEGLGREDLAEEAGVDPAIASEDGASAE
jgi:ubiquinol-cytochrome c reductase cytochrome b subunit